MIILRNRTNIVILFSVLFNGLIFCQVYSQKSETRTHVLTSSQNIEYQVLVTLPPGYDESRTYPTLFYLDAWWLEDVIKGTYNLLNRSKTVEEVILVGISIDGNELQFNQQRTRDFTPDPYDLDRMKFPFSIPLDPEPFVVTSKNSGKSPLFRKFLKYKVLPEIYDNYSIDIESKSLLGHSFGGLFGIYELAEGDSIFDSYIIISPALWWNKSEGLFDNLEITLKNNLKEIKLFVCYGALEGMSILKRTDLLNDFFKSKDFKGLKYHFDSYEGEDHVSVLPKSIYDGIEFVFKK